MDPEYVLDPSRYRLRYLGDPDNTSDNLTVEFSIVTESAPADMTGVTDADDYYVPFPGRGVRLRVEGIPGARRYPADSTG